MNYLDAYSARLKRNEAALIQLIKDVQQKDSSIDAYIYSGDNHIGHVVFIKDELINSIGFHEVPYRWSGCGYSESHNSHNGGDNVAMPFTAEDVLSTFKPITNVMHTYKERFKDKAHYLKWCSYLKPYKS